MHKRILILEDDINLLMMYSELLMRAGHFVQSCSELTSAHRMLSAFEFDLMICDLQVEQANLLPKIKRLNQTYHTMPIIIVSGNEHCRETCERAGFELFISKPVNLRQLNELVTRLVQPVYV